MSEAISGTTLTPPRISLRSSGLQASRRCEPVDLPDLLRGVFFPEGLNRISVICPSYHLFVPDDVISSLRAEQINPHFFLLQWIALLAVTDGSRPPTRSVH